jgi:predicted component of type VI protein secretion system
MHICKHRHFEIIRQGDEVILKSTHSNYTLVNGKAISTGQSLRLQENAEIQVGGPRRVSLKFVLVGSSTMPAPSSNSAASAVSNPSHSSARSPEVSQRREGTGNDSGGQASRPASQGTPEASPRSPASKSHGLGMPTKTTCMQGDAEVRDLSTACGN